MTVIIRAADKGVAEAETGRTSAVTAGVAAGAGAGAGAGAEAEAGVPAGAGTKARTDPAERGDRVAGSGKQGTRGAESPALLPGVEELWTMSWQGRRGS